MPSPSATSTPSSLRLHRQHLHRHRPVRRRRRARGPRRPHVHLRVGLVDVGTADAPEVPARRRRGARRLRRRARVLRLPRRHHRLWSKPARSTPACSTARSGTPGSRRARSTPTVVEVFRTPPYYDYHWVVRPDVGRRSDIATHHGRAAVARRRRPGGRRGARPVRRGPAGSSRPATRTTPTSRRSGARSGWSSSGPAPERSEVSPLIELDDVAVTYGTGGRAVRALDGIDLRVDAGERVALLGPSGAGKTTLLRVLGGRVRPSSGRATVLGPDIVRLGERAGRAVRRRIGTVHQDFALTDSIRVVHNVNAGRLGEWSTWRALASLVVPVGRAEVEAYSTGRTPGASRRPDRRPLGRAAPAGGGRPAADPGSRPRPRRRAGRQPRPRARPADGLGCWPSVVATPDRALVVSLHDPALARAHCDRFVGLRDGRVRFDGPAAGVGDRLTSTRSTGGDHDRHRPVDRPAEASPSVARPRPWSPSSWGRRSSGRGTRSGRSTRAGLPHASALLRRRGPTRAVGRVPGPHLAGVAGHAVLRPARHRARHGDRHRRRSVAWPGGRGRRRAGRGRCGGGRWPGRRRAPPLAARGGVGPAAAQRARTRPAGRRPRHRDPVRGRHREGVRRRRRRDRRRRLPGAAGGRGRTGGGPGLRASDPPSGPTSSPTPSTGSSARSDRPPSSASSVPAVWASSCQLSFTSLRYGEVWTAALRADLL